MPRTFRSVLWIAVLASGLCLLFATRVFIDIDRIRVKVLRQPVMADAGAVHVGASNPQLAALHSPVALIARIHSAAPAESAYSVSVDGQTVCTATVKPGGPRRIDCAVSAWRHTADHDITITTITGPAPPWTLSYLEMATHHGSSTPPLRAFVLPRQARNYRLPTWWEVAAAWLLLCALLLLPRRSITSWLGRAFSGTAIVVTCGLWFVLLAAPHLSPYRIVISVGTFAWMTVVPLAPRVLPLAWRYAWPRFAAAIRSTPLVLKALGQAGVQTWRAATAVWAVLAAHQLMIVMALALAVTGVAITYGARAAGGADEYGYVSQADLWLQGNLKITQPINAKAPWPWAERSFTPLGYRPYPLDRRQIVPTYAPGLPLLLALAKAIGGQTAMFVVAPISAGLLVLATYWIGRRMGDGSCGLVAAWLIATSPVVLFMMMSVMSDVPVAAAWSWAFYLLLGTSVTSAVGAGFLSGLAVLIRPNLAPLAGVFALHYLLALRTDERRRRIAQFVAFGVAAVPFAIAVAFINKDLYGSPFASGYGKLSELYSWARVPTNVRLYLGWLVEAQTPVALAGFLALFVPVRRWWPGVPDRRIFIVIGLFVIGLWANYCAWVVFDVWWFTRFLIASWPFIMLGLGAIATAVCRNRGSVTRALVITAVLVLGVVQTRFAERNVAFSLGDGHRAIVGVARLVQRVTPPRSVIISLAHSGSIRYYGGRMTLNYANLLPSRLDQAVEWLGDQGISVYAALEGWELHEVKQRFAGSRRLAILDAPPLAIYETPGQTFVFDLTGPPAAARQTIIDRDIQLGWGAPRPAENPRLLVDP